MTQSSSENTFALVSWPLALGHYDRSPELRQEEHDELVRLFEQSHNQIRSSTKRRLKRLVDPLEGCIALDMRSQQRFLCDHTYCVHRDAPTPNDVLGLVH